MKGFHKLHKGLGRMSYERHVMMRYVVFSGRLQGFRIFNGESGSGFFWAAISFRFRVP